MYIKDKLHNKGKLGFYFIFCGDKHVPSHFMVFLEEFIRLRSLYIEVIYVTLIIQENPYK